MTNHVEVRVVRAGGIQIFLAVAACFGLFIAGMAFGRVTKDSPIVAPIPEAAATPVADGVPAADVETSGAVPQSTSSLRADIEAVGDVADTSRVEEAGLSVFDLERALDPVELGAIGFEGASDVLTAEGRAAVGHLATVLVDHPFIPVEVTVSTYTEATPGANHGLSSARAEAIYTALAEAGVSPNRLVSVGLGSRSELPTGRSVAVRLSSAEPALGTELDAIDSLRIDLTEGGALTDDAIAVLQEIEDVLRRVPGTDLTLVGYGYAHDAVMSHELSHQVIDAAVAWLAERGVDPTRLSTVGLGDAPLNVDLDNMVDLKVGAPAAISLALGDIDNAVRFIPHTAITMPESDQVLDEIAAALAFDRTLSVEISFHTYTEDSSQANHDLSEQQGVAVLGALEALGVDRARLHMVAHGDPQHFARRDRETYITFHVLQ